MEVYTWPPRTPGEEASIFMLDIFPRVLSSAFLPILHTLLSWLHYSHSALVTMKLLLPPFIFQHLHSQSPESLPSQKLSNSSEIQNWNNKPKWGCNSIVKTPHVTTLRNAKSVPKSAIIEDSMTKCFCPNSKFGTGLSTHLNGQGLSANNFSWKPKK